MTQKMEESQTNCLPLQSPPSPKSMVKSCAIVKYGGPQSRPSKFLHLSNDTNIKTPPDNWLCGRFGHNVWSYPLKRHNSSMLSSFRMANHHPDCVGTADVIADADCIKQLLAMPFDDSQISMMVHRVGKTLLIDEYDVSSHLLRTEVKQWNWLRKFLSEHVMFKSDKNTCIMKKPITRYELQNRNMFCKFLHHSFGGDAPESASSPIDDETENIIISSLSDDPVNDTSGKKLFVDDENLMSLIPEMVDQQLKNIENDSGGQFKGPLRNVLWTFEDIHMLVSSNMPIFGDSNHPAVSLRLHDMRKPINVLTGLDYWLDNLMCSVPEVVMCYHLDGIVQKYELIKTEDIPQMKNSQFNVTVIRNIAQNILAFLKSKATKSGHTYWLFKGKHDDVVKLYDLTTLCDEYMDEDDSNPYTVPVAMLLYRVAKNMIDSNKQMSPVINKKVHKLLLNCLSLLDFQKHQQIVSSAKYLLSEIYVPNDIDPTLLPFIEPSDSESETYDDDYDDHSDIFEDRCESPLNNPVNEECPTLNVKTLKCKYANYTIKRSPQKDNNDYGEFSDDLKLDWPIKCHKALSHVIDGLKLLHEPLDHEEDRTKVSNKEEKQQFANPFQAIPLHFKSTETDNECNETGKAMTPKGHSKQKDKNWKSCIEICLLQKGVQVFSLLSELANNNKNGILAFKYAKMAFLCYECAQILMDKSETNHCHKEPLSCLLALCGDIHVTILSTKNKVQENVSLNTDDIIMKDELIELLEMICQCDLREEYLWAYNSVINFNNEIEERLMLSSQCYDEALNCLGQSKTNYDIKALENLKERITRRLGNVTNELACYLMNSAFKKFTETDSPNNDDISTLNVLLKKSQSYLDRSLQLFKLVSDTANIALVYSNYGRLMRTSAHIFAPHARSSHSSEFSVKERQFYHRAINNYQMAFKTLGNDGELKFNSVWININWELCTTYFTIGCLMQDFAPLTTTAYEIVERDISDYLKKALQLCTNAEKWDNHRTILYQYRSAVINHRLGSLFHNSYRNSSDSHGQKQLFNLADDYYIKSQILFESLNKIEFLRVSLERIGLYEHFLTSLDGFSSKIKTLHSVLRILLSIFRINFNDNEMTVNDKLETEKFLNMLETRVCFCVEGIVKCYSKRASKNKELLKQWKDIEKLIIENTQKEISIYERIENFSRIIQTSKLVTSEDGGDNK